MGSFGLESFIYIHISTGLQDGFLFLPFPPLLKITWLILEFLSSMGFILEYIFQIYLRLVGVVLQILFMDTIIWGKLLFCVLIVLPPELPEPNT